MKSLSLICTLKSANIWVFKNIILHSLFNFNIMQKNKHIVSTLILAAAFLLFHSCKKDKDEEKTTRPGKECKTLSYTTQVMGPSSIQPWAAYFEYSDGQITSITRRRLSDSGFISRTEYEYSASGNLQFSRSSSRSDSFVYSGGLLHRIYTISNNPYRVTNSFHVEYSGGKLSKLTQVSPLTNKNEGEYRLQWTGDNVTKVTITDSVGTEISHTSYSDYDNSPNPMRAFTSGLFSNIRPDLDVFTYLSKNNYRKINYSGSAVFRFRKVVLNSDSYPDTIYNYRDNNGVLNDSSFHKYRYSCP
jgi:hypothetical protein